MLGAAVYAHVNIIEFGKPDVKRRNIQLSENRVVGSKYAVGVF
jgi:hypothetical protein